MSEILDGPQLYDGPLETAADAHAWLAHATGTLQLNFHWDTRGPDYVNYASSGRPTFTAQQAAQYEAQLETAMAILYAAGLDPYAVALDYLR